MLRLIRSTILGVLALAGPCSCIAPGTAWVLNAGFHADIASTPPTSGSGVSNANLSKTQVRQATPLQSQRPGCLCPGCHP